MSMDTVKTCMLMILDGWGINPSSFNNAVAEARTPNLDRLLKEYPNTQLTCSGSAVGLPDGIMGNSEVGHLNIGAGRTVFQTLLRIDNSIRDGSFASNEILTSVMSNTVTKGSALHLMGLVSDGGVHSQLKHLFALIDMAEATGVEKVCIHAILDGRDTPPDSGVGYIEALQAYIGNKKNIAIATICGRFYAMDRDTRWERTEKAYRLYVDGEGLGENDPVVAVKNAYARGETDEFVQPVYMENVSGKILENDGFVFFNFRADRARQITRAFTDLEFREFTRENRPQFCGFVCMSLYDDSFNLPVAFGPLHLEGILGEVISKNGLNQLRIAETEKYAHVTYFFNGGEEVPFDGEDRCLIPSPRDAATYDEQPEMSAFEVTDQVVSKIKNGNYHFIVINFANMDMVGHTGIMEAAVKAVETVDSCVGRVVDAFLEHGGSVVLTADHGNSEQMADENGGAHTAHTLNPVPLVLIDRHFRGKKLNEGSLADIAPTILEVMGLEKNKKMTGSSLINL